MSAADFDTSLIEHCRQVVRVRAAALIGRCLDAARASLEQAARDSDPALPRQAIGDALERLDQRREAIGASFPAALDQAIAGALDDGVGKTAETETAHGRDAGALTDPAGATREPGEVELALLDDSALTHFVEAARLEQAVQPVVERALARLDSLMSSALAQPVVRPDLNPLRPQVPCRALMRVLGEQGDATEVRRLWLRHLAKTWAQELKDLYQAVGDLLEQQGVEEARYRVKLAPGGAGLAVSVANVVPLPSVPGALTMMAGDFAPGGQTGPGRAPESEEELSDDEAIRRRRAPSATPQTTAQTAPLSALMPPVGLRALPQGVVPIAPLPAAQPHDAPLPPDYYATVARQLSQLARLDAAPAPDRGDAVWDEAAWLNEAARLRALAVVDRPVRVVTPTTPLPLEPWGEQIAAPRARERAALEIKARAVTVGQARGLVAVRAQVAAMADDTRFLAPVRQAIVALEPTLLRLALAEPGFPGEEGHPAWRLVDEVAQHGLSFNDEFSADFGGFIVLVRAAVRELDALAAPSGRDFGERLQALQTVWLPWDEAAKQAIEQARRTMTFAQERQTLADKIAWDFSQRSDLEGVPAVVAGFLFRDWSLVIAHAQLASGHGQLDPGGYLSIITGLLWSVKRDEILNDSARLFEVVPNVVSTLRRGLEMLGKEPRESQALFDTLLRLHEPVLKLRRARIAIDQGTTPEELAQALEPPEAGDESMPRPQAARQPWIGPREREAIGFIDSGAEDLPAQTSGADEALAAVDAPASAETATAPETEARVKAQLGQLRGGDWVDLYWRQAWHRAELAWVGEGGALYLFAGRGGPVYGMARHTLAALLRVRHLRPVETGARVARASGT